MRIKQEIMDFVRLFSAWFVGYGGILACSEGAFGVDYARRRDSITL